MLLKKYSEETQALCAGCSKAGPQTNKQTNKHKNKQKTDRGDYNTLRSLERSVINVFCLAVSTYCYKSIPVSWVTTSRYFFHSVWCKCANLPGCSRVSDHLKLPKLTLDVALFRT